jgi:hypothetical protein
MIPLLLALLPLDLIDPSTASTANGLHLDAIVEAQQVSAELTNVSNHPQRLFLGYSCSGPEPFEAVIDGIRRPFVSKVIDCSKNISRVEVLAPGERRRVPSATVLLDGETHRVAVRYAPGSGDDRSWGGALTSAPITVHAGQLSIEVVAKPSAIRDGVLVTIDIIHRWYGKAPIRFHKGWVGVCGGPIDQLFVDGEPRAFTQHVNCDQLPPIDVEVVPPGGVWITHGSVVVAPADRPHVLHARYSVDPVQAAVAQRADNMDVYVGRVESSEVWLNLK